MPRVKSALSLRDVKTVLQLAQEGLKGIGVPGVEAIAAIPLKMIEYCEAITSNKDDMEVLSATLGSLQDIVFEPVTMAHERGHRYVPELTKRVHKLSGRLAEMKEKLGLFVELGRWKSFRMREEISSMLNDISRTISQAISQFQLEGQISVEMTVWSLGAEHLLADLKPADARFDASEKQTCLPNTRSGLLATLHQRIHHDPYTFICLYGSPGTGKSAVAKSIATSLHRDGLLAASYFFDRRGGSVGNNSLSTFVSTLVYQLARFSFDFYSALCDQLRTDPLLAKATADVRLRELLLAPIRSLPLPRKSAQRWIIVLDALDECGDADQQQQLMALLRACGEPEAAGLRDYLVFVITCRPETELTRVLKGRKLGPYTLSESMDDQDRKDTTNDINAFITAKVEEIQSAEGWTFLPDPPDILQFAVLCDGLFEVAAVRMRMLAKDARRFPLRRAFPDALRAAERSPSFLPPLQSVYSTILAAAYDFADDPNRRPEVLERHHSLLGALTCIRQPLSIASLSALVGLAEDEAQKTLEPLSSVIAVPDSVAPVHFYHASFLDFLLSAPLHDEAPRKTASYRDYLMHSLRCDLRLAKQCLTVMNMTLRYNILDLQNIDADMGPPSAIGGLRGLAERVPLHLAYACVHWAEHLRETETPDLDCRDLLVHWCDQKVMFYFEALSLLGRMGGAIPLLVAAEEWAQKVPGTRATVSLLSDSRQLVHMFYLALSRCPGAVYSSALLFMPSCDLHFKYSSLQTGGLAVVHHRPDKWPTQLWACDLRAPIRSTIYSPDRGRIAASTGDDVHLISAVSGMPDRTLHDPRGFHCVAFSPNSLHLVSGGEDSTLAVWSVITGEKQLELRGHRGPIFAVAFSTNGRHIISASGDGTVRTWSAVTGEQERLLQGHTAAVLTVAASPDGVHIASGSRDRSVRIWHTSTTSELSARILEEHSASVCVVSFSPDGTRLASGSEDLSVCVRSVDVNVSENAMVLSGHDSPVAFVAFSPDDHHLLAGTTRGTMYAWSAKTGQLENVLRFGKSLDLLCSNSLSATFFPDSAHTVFGSCSGIVQVSSVSFARVPEPTGRMRRGERDASVRSAAFSPDGVWVYVTLNLWSSYVWSTRSGAEEYVRNRGEAEWPDSPPTRFPSRGDGMLYVNQRTLWIPDHDHRVYWFSHDTLIVTSPNGLDLPIIIHTPPNSQVEHHSVHLSPSQRSLILGAFPHLESSTPWLPSSHFVPE